MAYINRFIEGVPYSKAKTRGDREAAKRWTEAVKRQTESLSRVRDAGMMKVTFVLPIDKFPPDFPYGSDLDNLLKRFLDAINQTIFSEAVGGDSCVVAMTVMKTRASSLAKAGAHLEVLPVQVG